MNCLILAALFLAGQQVVFDGSLTPQFTSRQVRGTNDATRAGLVALARTEHGQTLIRRLMTAEYELTVTEDEDEESIGRAPQPGLAALLAADDHSKRKVYELILNPDYFRMPKDAQPVALGQPTSAADAMALAWAGEMLHIYFYSKGISLPHHQRRDFQLEWRSVATELGFGTLKHQDGD